MQSISSKGILGTLTFQVILRQIKKKKPPTFTFTLALNKRTRNDGI